MKPIIALTLFVVVITVVGLIGLNRPSCAVSWAVESESLDEVLVRAGITRTPDIRSLSGTFCFVAADGARLAELPFDRLASSSRGYTNLVIDDSKRGSPKQFKQSVRGLEATFASLRVALSGVGVNRSGATTDSLSDQLADLLTMFPITPRSNEGITIGEVFRFRAGVATPYEIHISISVISADTEQVIYRVMTYVDEAETQ
jgi:hypothetical protein